MTDGRALLAAICAEPEEDTPRLAYADWLEEHGDENDRARAAFIRTQIERYRMPPEDDDADTAERRLGLEDREAALRRSPKHAGARAWAHSQHPEPPGTPDGVRYLHVHPDWFVRGFRGFAKSTPERFAEVGPGFFDVHPVHGLYDDRDAPPLSADVAERFLACPWLKRVRRLEMNFDGPAAKRIFWCEHLAGLEHLVIRRATFSSSVGTATLPGRLSGVRVLTLSLGGTVEVQRYAVNRLADLLPNNTLTEFTLEGGIGDPLDALQVISERERFANLARLNMSLYSGRDGRTVPGFGALTAAALWPGLRSLRFPHGFQDVDALDLARASPAPELRRLDLGRHMMTEVGLKALASSAALRSVTELKLRRSLGRDDWVPPLAHSPHLVSLASLDLEDCGIGPKGVKAFAEAPWSAGLVKLNLQRNPIKKAGVEALVAPGRFPRLRRLEVFGSIRTGDLREKLYTRFGDAVRFHIV